jgi:hypothetical protein
VPCTSCHFSHSRPYASSDPAARPRAISRGSSKSGSTPWGISSRRRGTRACPQNTSKGASTLLVLVLVGRLVWLLLVLVNLRPHYFSCSPGFGGWGPVYLLVVCIGCSTSMSNVDRPLLCHSLFPSTAKTTITAADVSDRAGQLAHTINFSVLTWGFY